MGLFSRLRSRVSSSPTPRSTVIVPLYMYPADPTTWQPLYDAIDDHPTLTFVVIINPDSGPGQEPWWPNLDYLREVPKLNSRSNVTTVGYVPIDYCNRDPGDVIKDIGRYARWPHESGVKGLHVEGIFFDETPDEHSTFKGTYLHKCNTAVQGADGILGDQIILHNPGTPPDAGLTSKRPDVTVVFESSYAKLQSLTAGERRALESHGRQEACYMVHSVPREQLREVTREARQQAQFVFVTDATDKFYESFGDGWKEFIEAMAGD